MDMIFGKMMFMDKIKRAMGKDKSDVFLFLEGKQKNMFGLSLNDFLSYNNKQIENEHGWIQWVFPTPEQSAHDYSPPCSLNDIKRRNNDKIQSNMRKCYHKIRGFYSTERSKKWITKNNHNYLRISRILRSLRVFGLNDEADEFFSYLTVIYKNNPDVVTKQTYEIWKERNKKNKP